MRTMLRELERSYHGILAGAVLAFLAGLVEYAWLFHHGAVGGDAARSYHEILLPYALAGVAAGILVAGVARLTIPAGNPIVAHVARVWAWLLALVLVGYGVIHATYWLGRPFLKPTNMVMYLAAVIVAVALAAGLDRVFSAVLVARAGRRRWPGLGRVPVALGLGVALGVLLVLPPVLGSVLAGGPPAAKAVRARGGPGLAAAQPNVVFILIDTLRADHLPMYGYSRDTAPVLMDLARRSATFTRMYAQAAMTKPSVATLFSSVYPSVHKVHDDHDFLPESLTVLAEVLRAAGYRTFGVSANANVSPTFGYSQGFHEFRVWKTERALRLTMMGRVLEYLLGPGRLTRLLGERSEIVPRADVITDLALEWASRHAQEQVFLYVHYIDPHFPYRAPAPYDQRFDYRRQPPRRAPSVDPLELLRHEERGAAGQSGLGRLVENEAQKVAQTLDHYDGEIYYMDQHLGRLLQGLQAQGVLDDAIVIVTSDHGEEFFEHGYDGHGKSAYEEVLRVPFLVHWPGRVAPAVHEHPVGLIDVMPTLLAMLGIETQAEMQGISFAGTLFQSPERPGARRLFAQVQGDSFALEMASDGRHKLIRHLRGPRQGEEEFYDLAGDPLERTNLAARSVPVMAGLREDIEAFNMFMRRHGSRVAAERVRTLDRATERALRSLGYIK